jgi:hypothetical protein
MSSGVLNIKADRTWRDRLQHTKNGDFGPVFRRIFQKIDQDLNWPGEFLTIRERGARSLPGDGHCPSDEPLGFGPREESVMVRSAIVGLVAVLLIAKVATGLRFIMPNSVERTETKEFAPQHTKNFEVHAENGSVEIVGQDDASANIEITSVLQASAHDEEAAAAALEAMEVTIEGMEPGQEKETCKVGWRWKTPRQIDWSGSVRFKILAPEKVNANCDAQNGPVTVTNLSGTAKLKSQNGKIVAETSGNSLEARTQNGVIEAKYKGPHVQLHTHNGTISADLSHARAVDGEVTTQNGAVALTVGDDTSCKLSASTVNGRVLMPNPKRGWLKRLLKAREVHETLGNGGGTLKVAVQNGVIKVKHVKAGSDSDSSDDDEESDD